MKKLFSIALALLGFALAAHAQLSTVYSFAGLDGAWARGSLTWFDGSLYGQTSIGGANNSGTIFSLTPNGLSGVASLNWSYSFDAPLTTPGTTNEGDMPHHNALVAADGALYDAALYGGNQNNPSPQGVEAPPPPPHFDKTGNGALFSIQTNGTGYTPIHTFTGSTTDGANAHSPFMLYDGVVSTYQGVAYGMTQHGGANNTGTIYSFSLGNPSDYHILYSFSATTGSEPHGVLTVDSTGQKLLGMTRLGGTASGTGGVVFSYDLAASDPDSAYQVLHSFTGGASDGSTNMHGYVTRVGTTIYGTTRTGGEENGGGIFSMNEDGSDFLLLHSFGGLLDDGLGGFLSDGASPYGSLVMVDGKLYGTTSLGGAGGVGTIFSLDLNGGAYTLLDSFDLATTGGLPEDNLTLSADGLYLYGLTQTGGINDATGTNYYGTIYALAIPEPANLMLISAGLAAILVRRRRA